MKTVKVLVALAALSTVGIGGVAYADAKSACMGDFQKLCDGVQPGGGRVMKCLKEHEADLSPECKDALAGAKDKMSKMKENGGAAGMGAGAE